jgi:hypothetical protein
MSDISKRGGKRPGAGGKVNIPERLILLDVALGMGVGLSRARQLIREWRGAERIIGDRRCHDLRRWGFSKDGPIYLEIHEKNYADRRAKWGYKS